MTLKQAFFILRHGSAEGNHKYLEAVKVIEDEYNRQKETAEQLKTALFKCGEYAAEVENYKNIAEHQQSISMDRFFEIQRLREEIERLQKECDEIWEERENYIDKAVKEFAERLKAKSRYPMGTIYVETIDNLVKEFTEGG